MQMSHVGTAGAGPKWTRRQALVIGGIALTIIFDGIDNQLIGPTIPSLMQAWDLPREAFTRVLAAGPVGMLVGGFVGGWFGDHVGRRTALLLSVMVFAALTFAVSFADGPGTLTILRFLAGLGLGGALPNAAVLAAESVPEAHRPVAVTVTIVCVPLGGFIAAFAAARLIEPYGWQTLWRLGGLLPIVMAGLLFKVLPESPSFLARKRGIASDTRQHEEQRTGLAAYAALFEADRLRDTLGLWFAFFFCLIATYLAVQWMPTMLSSRDVGLPLSVANEILSVFNLGGVLGALLASVAITKFGSRGSMLTLAALAIVSAVSLAALPITPTALLPLYLLVGCAGGLINAVQSTMYALAAHVYPTEIRGRGVGTAVAVGRVGHALTGTLGPWAMSGGVSAYFLTWAGAMGLVLFALGAVKRHISRPAGD